MFKYSRLISVSSMYSPSIGGYYWIGDYNRFFVLFIGTVLNSRFGQYNIAAGMSDERIEAFEGEIISSW